MNKKVFYLLGQSHIDKDFANHTSVLPSKQVISLLNPKFQRFQFVLDRVPEIAIRKRLLNSRNLRLFQA